MKYEIITNSGSPIIQIQAEESDQWTGFAMGGSVKDGLLDAGLTTLKNGKRVNLKIRIEGKPELIAMLAQLEIARAEYKTLEARTVKIYLSSRGWGDYSSLEWRGDITRPDSEILAEYRNLLTNGHDVDERNQTDDEILGKIAVARSAWESVPDRKADREKAEAEDTQRKIETGYCFACESYCHGDCGNYSADPLTQLRNFGDNA